MTLFLDERIRSDQNKSCIVSLIFCGVKMEVQYSPMSFVLQESCV